MRILEAKVEKALLEKLVIGVDRFSPLKKTKKTTYTRLFQRKR